MAISKQQPMRSAEIQLVDEVNTLSDSSSSQGESIDQLLRETQTLSGAIAIINAEIGNGFGATNTIESVINGILLDIGDTSSIPAGSSIMTMLTGLGAIADKIRIGHVDNLEAVASASLPVSATFPEPFGADAQCIVFAQVVTSEARSLFDTVVIGCDYSGFSGTVVNKDTSDHVVSLGYVAIRVN